MNFLKIFPGMARFFFQTSIWYLFDYDLAEFKLAIRFFTGLLVSIACAGLAGYKNVCKAAGDSFALVLLIIGLLFHKVFKLDHAFR